MKIDLDKSEFDQLAVINHHNVFEDLFTPGVYFHNTQGLEVQFGDDGVVSFGNSLSAASTVQPPRVQIGEISERGKEQQASTQAQKSTAFNTLLMLNLDGDGFVDAGASPSVEMSELGDEKEAETKTQLLHWLVANIPSESSGLEKGELIVPYLQPLPFYGSGYHRVAFLLLRHQEKVDLSSYRVDST